MTGGEIAGIVLASAVALLVLFIGVPLVKLGRLIDETSNTVKTFNKEFEPILAETKVTLADLHFFENQFFSLYRLIWSKLEVFGPFYLFEAI